MQVRVIPPSFRELADGWIVIGAVVAQDFAAHGTYTDPKSGIQFYTSYEVNGTITGSGEMSTVSLGGFTFGMALPADAATKDASEYIGYIVSCQLGH